MSNIPPNMDPTPIPGVPGLPLLGNVNDIDPENPILSLMHLADIYGPIYKLVIAGTESINVTSVELLGEMCDEKRFQKMPSGALVEVRNGIGDGLFTAFQEEPNWGLAHRVLMPSFGPMAIRGMYDEMLDIASQFVTKWARYGPNHKIPVTDDFTRLTLDSIALCAMDTRFNSFYKDEMHPFVDAMQFFLAESGNRARRPAFATNYIYRQSTKKYWESIDLMRAVAKNVIEERRKHPTDKKDLVNAMLLGRDPKTGKGLSDDNIMNNMITFMIAGHETTSGLLSFLFVLLLKHPQAYKTAQNEVDEVVGKGAVTYEHMSKLPYLTACIREALRLHPTAPSFSVVGKSEDPSDYPIYIGKAKYPIQKGQAVRCVLPKCHVDPAVYGEDADQFRPERMLDGKFEKLPSGAWKPFGNGARACIGRGFALQEAHLAVALLLQNFNFRADDPSYQLSYKTTLTIKPKDFYMYATLREGIDPIYLEKKIWNDGKGSIKTTEKDRKIEKIASGKTAKKPMLIFYGSNTGTCESLAQTLANNASGRGFHPTVKALDAAADNIPKNQPVVIINASYEGQPTDNSIHFMEWLQDLKGDCLEETKYAVFGCGHRDWQATFQKIPKLTDELLAARGSKRLATLGHCDVSENNISNDFDRWSDEALWPAVSAEYGASNKDIPQGHGLDIEISTGTRHTDLRQNVSEAIVKDVRVLTAAGEPEKRHVEIQLPTEMTYSAGDYLAVLPHNYPQLVKRVMNRFSLAWDARINIKEGQNTMLPTGRDMPVYALLSSYVEINQPVSTKNVATIALSIPDPVLRDSLTSTLPTSISSQRVSALDLLERYPTAALPLGDYLAMLPPMRIRQYSISSSPLACPSTCTLTYSVLDQPSTADPAHKTRFRGIATSYLAELRPGDHLSVAVKPSHQAFHPPLDVERVPLLMVCAGTGLAPFRGFVMERAKQIEAGRTLAPAMLFVGCRHPERDVLYKAEFEAWQKIGAVDVRYAYSQNPEKSEGCKYVQERLWKDREEATGLWEKGAKIYVCGSGVVGEGVRESIFKSYMEVKERGGEKKTREETESWFQGIRNERYASDVFA